jgi:hypothetical protein
MPQAIDANVFAMSGEIERVTRMTAATRNCVPTDAAFVTTHPVLLHRIILR